MKSNPTPIERVASIDVGTNTFLLLIAEAKGNVLRPLLDLQRVVRLGQDLQRTGTLSQQAMKRALRTLDDYLCKCRALGVQRIYAIGTCALREALNAQWFLQKVKEELNLTIEVISGEEEAHLTFLSATQDFEALNKSLTVVDVGGGSTEIIMGRTGFIDHHGSLPLGAVRLTERFLSSDPVRGSEWNALMGMIEKTLQRIPVSAGSIPLVAIGGTATTLASVELRQEEFVPDRIHHFILGKEALESQVRLYRSMTIEERKRIPGLPSDRADIILAGAAILQKTMERVGTPSILISCHGIRYGVLYKRVCM